jgi:8-oxo-dGTP pyrophosphatase MutT (NUDIX family)
VHALRLAALRGLYRGAYRLLWIQGRLWPRRGRGVKCILTHGEEVLLVRHTYGPRGVWQLPGGAAHRGEPPLETARREMGEELGLGGLDWQELARTDLHLEHISVDLTCLHAELNDPTVRTDPVEIQEARWFSLAHLPRELGSEELRLLALLEGRELPEGRE